MGMNDMMNMIGRQVATKVIGAFDKSGIGKFGGQLAKAEIQAYKDEGLKSHYVTIPLWINPSVITTSIEAQTETKSDNQGNTQNRYSHTLPMCLRLGELWFDTYDTRENVRSKYINKLESLVRYHRETHVAPWVVFNWGNFTQASLLPALNKFMVTKVETEYCMFLEDGTPVRAKVALSLEQYSKKTEEKQSPDHAKLYTVKAGDTLQGIAYAEYDNAAEWRRIANTNKLDDPMSLYPGQKLLIPPILR